MRRPVAATIATCSGVSPGSWGSRRLLIAEMILYVGHLQSDLQSDHNDFGLLDKFFA